MPLPTRLLIISLSIFCLFNSWVILSYPEPYVDTAPVVHIEKPKPIIYDKKATFTAYTLSEDETDGSPEIGAGGHNLKDLNRIYRVCASRTIPLHTRISIEGIGECEVLDRTSKKYSGRIDILMDTKAEAIKFGKKTLSYKFK